MKTTINQQAKPWPEVCWRMHPQPTNEWSDMGPLQMAETQWATFVQSLSVQL